MRKEPIRHHYVPQFILRNFCDERGLLHYVDLKSHEMIFEKPCNLFMERNLYRDEINHGKNPTKIERDFARYENEIAQLLREKFLNDYKIILKKDEEEKLKLFIAVMSFRSYTTKEFFVENLRSKEYYLLYQKNGDFLDFWKRNLGYLVNCRSLCEVINHEKIAEPIKIFMMRDTLGIFGTHFAVAEAREGQQFTLGDIYPACVTGEVAEGGLFLEEMSLDLYSINPISPQRVILLVSNGAEAVSKEVLGFRNCILYPPEADEEKGITTIHVKKIYPEEVKKINENIISAAQVGYVC